MFTGIVKYLAEVKSAQMVQDCLVVKIDCKDLLNSPLGSSICINGACMTLARIEDDYLVFEVIKESINVTNLSKLNTGSYVNLEPSLTLQDGIDGHLVTGHIDFVSELLQKNELNEYFFSVDSSYSRYLALKGSITINGVSLTISELSTDFFKVSLIPTTLLHTNLQYLDIGDKVNIEVDLIARYLDRLMTFK